MRAIVPLLCCFAAVHTLAAQAPTPLPSPYLPDTTRWPVHSLDRPKPQPVLPSALLTIAPPGDAIVLLDGRSLTPWTTSDGTRRQPQWSLIDGTLEVAPGRGPLESRQAFGDLQLHLEWSAPLKLEGEGQGRGNSGVLLMGRYEIQILDGHLNDTYADGMSGAIYGQTPPRVYPGRRSVEWNSYDIIFHRPRFDASGALLAPARLTLIYNGVVVHDDQVLLGPTGDGEQAPYQAHPDRLPLQLEDHGDKVRFRNIWVRPLE